ncbi:MAG TPA: TIGR03118 family protein [Gemmatimonadaceae bacterium]|nr:TIGR03118 family protein [Gemmatimonadaceae bacterium]
MYRMKKGSAGATLVALGLSAFVIACGDKAHLTGNLIASTNVFSQTNLVSDVNAFGATTVDANLVNPWGLAFGANNALWVANNGTGTSTLYDANGTKLALSVTIPPAGTPAGLLHGSPTGIVLNTTSDFTIPGSSAASFIFAGEDGSISAWNASLGSSAQLVADRSSVSAVYKGLAMAAVGSANRLYATDFHNNRVDVFDGSFALVGSFTDSTMSSGYAPFGIANIGGQLFVTFAKQQGPANVDDTAAVGNGFVDVFNSDGTLARRFASNGRLNSPWGLAQAPANFGPFGGAILVGNFGDGTIGAYDATSGTFLDVLRDAGGNPVTISGLWALEFGPSTFSNLLYFSSGPSDETHGLVGRLSNP